MRLGVSRARWQQNRTLSLRLWGAVLGILFLSGQALKVRFDHPLSTYISRPSNANPVYDLILRASP
jgi:hypothetical protein